jgi:hypothetical protein
VTQDVLRRLYDDLHDLQSWMDFTMNATALRMDESAIVDKIRALRDTKGRTPEERKTALRLAERLEKRFNARLDR